jgi:hypothetical protein
VSQLGTGELRRQYDEYRRVYHHTTDQLVHQPLPTRPQNNELDANRWSVSKNLRVRAVKRRGPAGT